MAAAGAVTGKGYSAGRAGGAEAVAASGKGGCATEGSGGMDRGASASSAGEVVNAEAALDAWTAGGGALASTGRPAFGGGPEGAGAAAANEVLGSVAVRSRLLWFWLWLWLRGQGELWAVPASSVLASPPLSPRSRACVRWG